MKISKISILFLLASASLFSCKNEIEDEEVSQPSEEQSNTLKSSDVHCYSTYVATTASSSYYITDIATLVRKNGAVAPTTYNGYTKIPINLNAGTNSQTQIYLYYKTGSKSNALDLIDTYSPSSTACCSNMTDAEGKAKLNGFIPGTLQIESRFKASLSWTKKLIGLNLETGLWQNLNEGANSDYSCYLIDGKNFKASTGRGRLQVASNKILKSIIVKELTPSSDIPSTVKYNGKTYTKLSDDLNSAKNTSYHYELVGNTSTGTVVWEDVKVTDNVRTAHKVYMYALYE